MHGVCLGLVLCLSTVAVRWDKQEWLWMRAELIAATTTTALSSVPWFSSSSLSLSSLSSSRSIDPSRRRLQMGSLGRQRNHDNGVIYHAQNVRYSGDVLTRAKCLWLRLRAIWILSFPRLVRYPLPQVETYCNWARAKRQLLPLIISQKILFTMFTTVKF